MDVASLKGPQHGVAIDASKFLVITEIEEEPMIIVGTTTDNRVDNTCGNNMTEFCTTIDNRTHMITLPKTCTIQELKELLWSKTG